MYSVISWNDSGGQSLQEMTKIPSHFMKWLIFCTICYTMCLFAFRQTVKWRWVLIIMLNFVSFYFSILYIVKMTESIELRFCNKLQKCKNVRSTLLTRIFTTKHLKILRLQVSHRKQNLSKKTKNRCKCLKTRILCNRPTADATVVWAVLINRNT